MGLDEIFGEEATLRINYENAVKSLSAREGVLGIFHEAGLVGSRDELIGEILDIGVDDYMILCVSNALFLGMVNREVEDRPLLEYFVKFSESMREDIALFSNLVASVYEKGQLMRLGMYKKD